MCRAELSASRYRTRPMGLPLRECLYLREPICNKEKGGGHHGREEQRDIAAGSDRPGSDPHLARALLSLRLAKGSGRIREPLYRRRIVLDERSRTAARAGTHGAAQNNQWSVGHRKAA